MSELENLRKDLEATIDALTKTAHRLKGSARETANKRSDYENKKNGYLIQLAAEDAESGNKPRTIALQTAMYRLMFKDERQAHLLAEADYESDRDLFKGIMAKLNALQSLLRITETEMRLGENFH